MKTTAETLSRDKIRPGRNVALRVSIMVAGLATVAVPVVVMAEEHIFGQEPVAHRVELAAIIAIAYAANYLITGIKSLIAYSASFVVTTALTMTLASAVFAVIVTLFSGWSAPSATVLYVRYFLALVVIANATFLFLSIRYTLAIREKVTPLGAIGGFLAALCMPGMFSWLSSASGVLRYVFRKFF